MIKTIKILMRITRRLDEDATTKRNPLRAMHLKKVKSLKTGLFTFFGDYNRLFNKCSSNN